MKPGMIHRTVNYEFQITNYVMDSGCEQLRITNYELRNKFVSAIRTWGPSLSLRSPKCSYNLGDRVWGLEKFMSLIPVQSFRLNSVSHVPNSHTRKASSPIFPDFHSRICLIVPNFINAKEVPSHAPD